MFNREKWSSKKSRDANSHPCPRRCLGFWCTWRARCVAAFNNQKKMPDVLLLFLRIHYMSLTRCSCYTHDPAHMSILLFYRHVYNSNSCVCVSKHVYAFPSSAILLHIYRHLHMYSWFMFYTYTHVFVVFFFFRNFIDTCVTLSIDVIIPLRTSWSSDSCCNSTL